MATSACANAGRDMHGTDALEDQGPALRLTTLDTCYQKSELREIKTEGNGKRLESARRVTKISTTQNPATPPAPLALRAVWCPYRVHVRRACVRSFETVSNLCSTHRLDIGRRRLNTSNHDDEPGERRPVSKGQSVHGPATHISESDALSPRTSPARSTHDAHAACSGVQ